jgi:hypothetical protein
MPPWGRPPGATDVGRYYEGTEEDVHRFQELDSEDEKNGVLLNQGAQQASNGKHLSLDELYFDDMDIRAWERRASGINGMPYGPGYDLQEEDEGYYNEAGEPVSHAEYEELLFRRVLDKIRIARATNDPDVQLSPEELRAYQSKLHGERSPAARSRRDSRPTRSPILDNNASILSDNHISRHDQPSSSKSKSKKSQPRTSLFSSKPKKENPSGRKRADSNVSSGASQVAPGFVVPGPDGQRIYTPINSYQGSLVANREPLPHSQSHSASGSGQTYYPPPRSPLPSEVGREVPGAFPGVYASPTQPYRPSTPPRQARPATSRQPTQEPAGSRTRSSSIQSANLVPFPIEPYQYQSFSPSSSSSQPSPQLQYTRRPSAPASEASYTSMSRRVPVPAQYVAPASTHFDPPPPPASYAGSGYMYPGEYQGAAAIEVIPEPMLAPAPKVSSSGKDGERKRKSGKTKKRT